RFQFNNQQLTARPPGAPGRSSTFRNRIRALHELFTGSQPTGLQVSPDLGAFRIEVGIDGVRNHAEMYIDADVMRGRGKPNFASVGCGNGRTPNPQMMAFTE